MKTLSQVNDKAMVPLRELERKAESNRAIYETFLAKAKAADEQQVIDTSNISPDEAANQIILHLEHEGYIEPQRD